MQTPGQGGASSADVFEPLASNPVGGGGNDGNLDVQTRLDGDSWFRAMTAVLQPKQDLQPFFATPGMYSGLATKEGSECRERLKDIFADLSPDDSSYQIRDENGNTVLDAAALNEKPKSVYWVLSRKPLPQDDDNQAYENRFRQRIPPLCLVPEAQHSDDASERTSCIIQGTRIVSYFS